MPIHGHNAEAVYEMHEDMETLISKLLVVYGDKGIHPKQVLDALRDTIWAHRLEQSDDEPVDNSSVVGSHNVH